jgi:hypothetical protein
MSDSSSTINEGAENMNLPVYSLEYLNESKFDERAFRWTFDDDYYTLEDAVDDANSRSRAADNRIIYRVLDITTGNVVYTTES